MNYEDMISVCYEVNGERRVTSTSDEYVNVSSVSVNKPYEVCEIKLNITNASDGDIFLRYVTLWQCEDIRTLGLGDAPYEVYRSGRHKNDMPGVYTWGAEDERLSDVAGGMTETGDKADAKGTVRKVISDHLTIISGSAKSVLVEFTGGRKQLFETVVSDEGIRSDAIFNIILSSGKCVESESLRVVWTDNVEKAVEEFAGNKAKQYGSRHGKLPAVFCTWYYYGLTVTYDDVKTNLEIIRDRKLPFDVFQVDEGWEITLGEWKPNHKFPVPMKQVADEIRQAGYTPGIWTSPFIAHETATIWQEHPEWKLLDKQGNPCLFHMNDTVYHVFDITNPATYDYFTRLYNMLTFEWGYTYHKLDFTRAAVIYEDADFYDKTVTLAEVYYKAVSAIRKGMGEEAYFLMCGGLYDPIIGLVDAQRTGSDVLSMWSSNINKDGKTAPYTIKQSVLRYYMNKWWDNDPDALMIRINENMERNLRLTYGLLNDEEVKTSVVNQFMGGGIMCATEPLDKISDERLMEYRRILPVLPRQVRPLDIMEQTRFPGMVDVYMESIDAHMLCVINWDDEESMSVDICVEKLLPDFARKDDKYLICDYYSGEYWGNVSADEVINSKAIAPHGANVFKVSKMQDRPLVVKSTGHYSMGGEIEVLEIADGKLHYVINNAFDCPIHYEILIPAGKNVTIIVDKGRKEGEIYI
ncbi:MAG: alpha-galactosidase [Lachnospira sp.]|nr:alpha-galactosidase [Lachnospira sp.]